MIAIVVAGFLALLTVAVFAAAALQLIAGFITIVFSPFGAVMGILLVIGFIWLLIDINGKDK